MDPKSYFNRFLPLGGHIALQQVATFSISPIPTSVDLRTVFGSADNGDGLMVKATQVGANASGVASWQAYFSLTDKPTTINENLFGPGTASGAQCWPLADGQEYLGHLTSGRSVGSGFASMVAYPVLNMKVGGADSGAMGTGHLKVMRATLVEPQDASRFQFPLPSGAPGSLPSGYLPRP